MCVCVVCDCKCVCVVCVTVSVCCINNSSSSSSSSSLLRQVALKLHSVKQETKFKPLRLSLLNLVRAARLLARCMSCSSPAFLPALHLQIQTPPPILLLLLPSSHPPLLQRGAHRHLSSHHTPPPLQAAAAGRASLSVSGWFGLLLMKEREGGGADGRTGCYHDFG